MDFVISSIIPVYNVEKYLEETLESVVNQTIGFKENIEVVLVNDGSPDNSEEICLRYKEMYPDNIKYYKQENAGVCAARNKGMTLATGKYIHFLDSDDKIDLDAYEKSVKMLEENEDIDVAALRLKYFEAKDTYHTLDYKFTGDYILDIREKYDCILIHGSTAIYRADSLKGIEFDSRVKISEDTKVLYQVVLQKGKYGVISSAHYYYRKRNDDSSAIQNAGYGLHWYINSLEYVHKYLIELSKEMFGEVIPYVQFFVMYDLQWRLKYGIRADMDAETKAKYLAIVKELLQNVDDSIILEQNNSNFNVKLMAVALKYGDEFGDILSVNEEGTFINGLKYTRRKRLLNTIDEITVTGDTARFVGSVQWGGDFKIIVKHGKNESEVETFVREDLADDYESQVKRCGYSVELSLKDEAEIGFYIECKGERQRLKSHFSYQAKLNNFEKSYYYNGKYYFTHKSNRQVIQYKRNVSKAIVLKRESLYLKKLSEENAEKQRKLRVKHWTGKAFAKKNVAVFANSDLFEGRIEEIVNKYCAGCEVYFPVADVSAASAELGKLGTVVEEYSDKHMLQLMNAKVCVMAKGEYDMLDEYNNEMIYYSDLMDFELVNLVSEVTDRKKIR